MATGSESLAAGQRWRWAFPPDPASCSTARRLVSMALAQASVPGATREAVHTVVGELTANAVVHAATDFSVALVIGAGTVRVEVFDADTHPPVLVGVDADATSGRGVLIVAAMADEWGWRTAARRGMRGKVVWARWRTPAGGPTRIALNRPLGRAAAHADRRGPRPTC